MLVAQRLLVLCAIASGAFAQAPAVPIRPLGPIVARTRDTMVSAQQIRTLSDGRIMVNDVLARRLVLFDSSLSHGVAIIDTSGSTQRAYGNVAGSIVPYAADSTFFVDIISRSLVLIDPAGRVAGTVALPRPDDLSYFGVAVLGLEYDGAGGFVYKLRPPGPAMRNAGPTGVAVGVDSTVLVRTHLDTKKLDTVAVVGITPQRVVMVPLDGGSRAAITKTPPFEVADGWVMLPDGTVGVVRAGDYHIDWIGLHGARTSTPKIPHEWVKLNDSGKQWWIDSSRRRDSISRASRVVPTGVTVRPSVFFDVEELPDYLPPFSGSSLFNSVRADSKGRVWVPALPFPVPQGGLVFDILDRTGTLVDRVQLPGGTFLAGFGPGDVVYLQSRVGTGVQIARARFR